MFNAFQHDVATHLARHFARHPKAKTRAGNAFVILCFNAVKLLEKPGLAFGGNPEARILDGNNATLF